MKGALLLILMRMNYTFNFLLIAVSTVILLGIIGEVHAATWYDSDWTYNKLVTIDSAQVDATLTDFPVLVNITDTDIGANAQADCDDILFTDNTHVTKYSHEIESCDLGNDKLTAWVEIPSISSSVDTEFYIYYGNNLATSQEDVAGTWSNNFLAVYHSHDDFLDSTSNNNDGTNNGSTDVVGIIADAQSFDSVNDRINYGSDASIDNLWNGGATISVWLNPNSDGESNLGVVIGKRDIANASIRGWMIRVSGESGGGVDAYLTQDGASGTNRGTWLTTNPDLTIGSWNNLWVRYDSASGANDPTFDINGIEKTVGSGITQTGTMTGAGGNDAARTMLAGGRTDGSRTFDGLIDEIQIASVTRSDAWVNAGYDNTKSGSTFLSFGSQQTEPSGIVAGVSDGIILGDSVSTNVISVITLNVSDGSILGDSIATSQTFLYDIQLNDGIILGDSVNSEVLALLTLNVSDGIILGDSIATSQTFLYDIQLNDGIILGDSVNSEVLALLTLNVSDGIILGDSIATSQTFLYDIQLNDGIILGDNVQAILFGDIPVNVSDGIILGDTFNVVIGCDVTCSRNVTDGIILGETSIDTTVSITTFNSIKLYVNSPASDRLGGVFAQSCSVGQYVSGIDATGRIECTILP